MPGDKEILLFTHISGKNSHSVGSGFDPVESNGQHE